jgi:hypothetical protein
MLRNYGLYELGPLQYLLLLLHLLQWHVQGKRARALRLQLLSA